MAATAAAASGSPAGPGSSAGPGVLLAGVRRAVAALRGGAPGDSAGDWVHEAREAAVVELDAVIKELTVYRGQVLLAHQAQGRWGSARDRDFADWRSRQTGIGRGAAVGDLLLAEGLEQMPPVAEAVERGELTLEHAKVLSRVRRTGSDEVRGALDGGGAGELVARARSGKLSAPQLGQQAKAWAAQVDAAAAQADFDAVRRRRSVTMRSQTGGVAGEFFLDPISGEQLRTALDAIAGAPAKDDERSKDQRMADALTTLAGRALQVGSDLNGAQVRPHLSLLVTEETWAGIIARKQATRANREKDGEHVAAPPLPDVPPAELEDGRVIPVGELERLMCDCEITRMVLDANAIPLDVGQTQRHFTKELRRAVTARDRHCQWPGCTLRASWCEVHHITWFSRGGHTALAEGITMCTYHHHRIHQLDIRITVRPDGFDFHYRDGRPLGETRRNTTPRLRRPHRRDADTLQAAGGATARASGSATTQAAGRPASTASAPCRGSGTAPPPARPRVPAAAGTEVSRTGSAGDPADGPVRGPVEATADPPTDRPPPAPVLVRPPPAAWKSTGSAVARQQAPLPSYPSTYATAPSTLWDSDPPF